MADYPVRVSGAPVKTTPFSDPPSKTPWRASSGFVTSLDCVFHSDSRRVLLVIKADLKVYKEKEKSVGDVDFLTGELFG